MINSNPAQPPAKDVFARHGLRCTPQRQVLFETLRQTKSHPTVEELHQLVVEQHDKAISLATVYNTVEVLCKAGLAKRFPTANGCCRYDADIGEHLHVRFTDTGEIVDVPAELSDKILGCLRSKLIEQVEQQLGISIENVNIQLHSRRHCDDAATGMPGAMPPNGTSD